MSTILKSRFLEDEKSESRRIRLTSIAGPPKVGERRDVSSIECDIRSGIDTTFFGSRLHRHTMTRKEQGTKREYYVDVVTVRKKCFCQHGGCAISPAGPGSARSELTVCRAISIWLNNSWWFSCHEMWKTDRYSRSRADDARVPQSMIVRCLWRYTGT